MTTEAPAPSGLRSIPVIPAVLAGALLCFGGGWLLASAVDGAERPRRASAAQAGPSNIELRLAGRVARLEADQRTLARAAAASLAVVSLSEAASDPTGFADALRAAEGVLPASPDLLALRPLAAQGAPTEAGLVASFPAAAARARTAGRAVDAGSSLSGWSRALGRVFSEAPPRPEPGVSPDTVLVRMEARLRGGDLPGAVKDIALLPPPARESLATWEGHARRRIEIEQRLASVRALTLRDLAAVTAAPAPPG